MAGTGVPGSAGHGGAERGEHVLAVLAKWPTNGSARNARRTRSRGLISSTRFILYI